MTRPQGIAPTRRGMMAGALGLGALGSMAMASGAEAALGDPTIPTDPENAFYLYLTGIRGTGTDLASQIPLRTWGWGAQSSTDPLAGGGGGSGTATPKEVIFVARTDTQSPKLVNALNRGSHITTAKISCVKGQDSAHPYTYATLSFGGVVVSDYYVTPDPSDGVPNDVVHLKLVTVSYSFIPQKQDGTPGTAVTYGFDYGRNVPL